MASKNIDSTITLNPRQTKVAMRVCDVCGDSMMIWGPAGIGKSSIAKQYANEFYPLMRTNLSTIEALKAEIANPDNESITVEAAKEKLKQLQLRVLDQDTNFVDFRLSDVDPADLRGIPVPEKIYIDQMTGKEIIESKLPEVKDYISKVVLVWAAPKLLQLPANWKGVIIFDEINNAMPIVQAAAYQLFLDRCVGEVKLPDGAFIMAAGNREQDGGNTFALATPLRDRMTHTEMHPDVEQWVEDYAIPNMIPAVVVGFLKNTGHETFNTLSSNDPSHCGGSSPRSWEKVGKFVSARADGLKEAADSTVYTALLAGRVGQGIAVQFAEYERHVATMPDSMDILEGKVKQLGERVSVDMYYFIALSLTYKLIEMQTKRTQGTVSTDKWKVYATNFIDFLNTNFGDRNDELSLMAVRVATAAGVVFRFAEVPNYRDFVTRYSDLIKRSRNIQ